MTRRRRSVKLVRPARPTQPEDDWVRFELKTDLSPGGTAAAYVLDTDWSTRGDEITVQDGNGSGTPGVGFYGDGSTESAAGGSSEGTGDKGWARWCEDSRAWEVKALSGAGGWVRNYELKTDLAGVYGATCTAYEIDAAGDRIPGSEFTLTCGPACHEGDGAIESGADGSGEGTGHTGSAAWKNHRWETQSMSCNVKPA